MSRGFEGINSFQWRNRFLIEETLRVGETLGESVLRINGIENRKLLKSIRKIAAMTGEIFSFLIKQNASQDLLKDCHKLCGRINFALEVLEGTNNQELIEALKRTQTIVEKWQPIITQRMGRNQSLVREAMLQGRHSTLNRSPEIKVTQREIEGYEKEIKRLREQQRFLKKLFHQKKCEKMIMEENVAKQCMAEKLVDIAIPERFKLVWSCLPKKKIQQIILFATEQIMTIIKDKELLKKSIDPIILCTNSHLERCLKEMSSLNSKNSNQSIKKNESKHHDDSTGTKIITDKKITRLFSFIFRSGIISHGSIDKAIANRFSLKLLEKLALKRYKFESTSLILEDLCKSLSRPEVLNAAIIKIILPLIKHSFISDKAAIFFFKEKKIVSKLISCFHAESKMEQTNYGDLEQLVTNLLEVLIEKEEKMEATMTYLENDDEMRREKALFSVLGQILIILKALDPKIKSRIFSSLLPEIIEFLIETISNQEKYFIFLIIKFISDLMEKEERKIIAKASKVVKCATLTCEELIGENTLRTYGLQDLLKKYVPIMIEKMLEIFTNENLNQKLITDIVSVIIETLGKPFLEKTAERAKNK